MKLENVLVSPDSHNISLNKLTGKTVLDVQGRLTRECGEITFKLSYITFTDGTKLWCEGEHDMPYVVDYDNSQTPESGILPSGPILKALYEEQ